MLAAWRDGSEWWIGGSVTLIGARTTVRHNCTDEDRATCGWLGVYSFVSSTIQLVSLLTDDIVSIWTTVGVAIGVRNQMAVIIKNHLHQYKNEGEVGRRKDGVYMLF